MMPVKSPSLKLFCLGSLHLAVAIALFVGVASGAPLVMAPQDKIDASVLKKLQELGIQPSDVCSDEVFVRRVYLDVIGTLPTAQEVRDFLADKRATKRELLIDQLLTRNEFADYWAMKWCDLLRVKSEFPINLWPNAVQAYHRWIRTSIKSNMPYDRFARELLISNGSNFRVPQVNFYRAVQNKTPKALAQTVALTFMGTRIERWPEAKQEGMAAFFSQVGYKFTAEWKEEIIFFDPSSSNAQMSATFPDGKAIEFAPDQDPREVFATWLVSPNNPWFSRCIANRAWSWFMGHGIIDEPDDIRPDNPPVNPELLAYLESELMAGRYDIKRIFAMILKSKTYQRSCIPKSNKPEAERNFAFYPVRRLEAEVLIDALNQITGATEKYTSSIPEPFSYIPENQRTITLADGSISSPFLGLYGRSARDTGLERERNNEPNASQRLYLLNSSHIQHKLEKGDKLIALFLEHKKSSREKVDALYLTILSRYPTVEEATVLSEYQQDVMEKRRVAKDIVWALINTAEFQCRH
jgi:hypothetical protein